MQVLQRPWGAMHYRVDGPAEGPPVVFVNSLGTDLRLWDRMLARLPAVRAIRFDKRGHGLSDVGLPDADPSDPAGLVTMADFADDVAALIEAEAGRPVVLVGLSMGGMIGQLLAATRPAMVRALVLSNTAARMGTAESWSARIAAIRQGGMTAIADAVMERWFAPAFRATPELNLWRNMLARTAPEGYIAACGALAQADLSVATAALRLPVLAIAGSEDGASPPDLVEATARLIAGAAFRLVEGAGHLPCVEAPAAYAGLLAPFLEEHAR